MFRATNGYWCLLYMWYTSFTSLVTWQLEWIGDLENSENNEIISELFTNVFLCQLRFTLSGSHGRLLMKKNCLSVALLPTPWSPRDTNPVMLSGENGVSEKKLWFWTQGLACKGATHVKSCLGRSASLSPYSSMMFSVGDTCCKGRRLWSCRTINRNWDFSVKQNKIWSFFFNKKIICNILFS